MRPPDQEYEYTGTHTWTYAELDALIDGNEDGSNRDVPPFDNDPRTDEEIKQSVYDAYDAGEWD